MNHISIEGVRELFERLEGGSYQQFLCFAGRGEGVVGEYLQCDTLSRHHLTSSLEHLAVVHTQATKHSQRLKRTNERKKCDPKHHDVTSDKCTQAETSNETRVADIFSTEVSNFISQD